jgi:DNA-binding XRE family transcriptional regulator
MVSNTGQHFVGHVNNAMLLVSEPIVGDSPGMAKGSRPSKVEVRRQFAERLKMARRRYYETSIQMAKAISVEPETYRRWERGETEPGIADLNNILSELEVSADYLVTGTLPPPPNRR